MPESLVIQACKGNKTMLNWWGKREEQPKNNHKSGTDRIEEAIEKIGGDWDVVVNIQGDEPFIQKEQILSLCECFKDPNTQIATLGKPFTTMDAVTNPNSPKIVLDNQNFAMYFSRSIIPYIRGKQTNEWINSYNYIKHLGIYAYRKDILQEITKLPQSSLEIAESLEQLRWLQNGYKIKVGITEIETVGIDTPDDLVRAEEFLKLQK